MPYVRPLSIEMSGRESSGPNTYAEVLMGSADAEGYPFWAPRSMGVVGDCGIVRYDGQFVTVRPGSLIWSMWA